MQGGGEIAGQPFSGKFSLRLSSKLHSKVAQAAATAHKSINSWVTEAVESRLEHNI